MTYAQAIEHLYALVPELAPAEREPVPGASAPTLRKFDLAHMRTLCEALGNPQDAVPSILIAGTNGKGSTAATLASIFTAAGYRTGLYTSPHLARVNERIQFARPILPTEYGSAAAHNADGPLILAQILDEDFARLYTLVDEAAKSLVADGRLPWLPSFFERLTAVAFLYFAGSEASPRAEIMILEVGLGGRLDATNIVHPLLSILTDIALDHQAFLGDTITKIAAEKAGILREGGRLITLSQHPEANQVIGQTAAALHVTGIDAAPYLPPATRNDSNPETTAGEAPLLTRNRYTLSIRDSAEPGVIEVDSPLYGEHQRRNLALAIAAAITLRNTPAHASKISNTTGYTITNAALESGISRTQWPGRLEWVRPNLLVDVAHNPAGAWTLRAALSTLPEDRPRTLIFSCLRDKNMKEMAQILFPLFDSSLSDRHRHHDHIILAPISNPRAADVTDLLAAAHAFGIPAHAAPHLEGALAQATQITPPNGLIVATGSVYLVGELRQLALAEMQP